MKIRSIGAAVLAAAALSVTLTGAASAGEPDHDSDRADDARVVVLRCEDGEVVRRELTDEERERLRTLPAEPARPAVPALPTGPTWTVAPERGAWVEGVAPHAVHVVPAEPGEPGQVACAVPARP